MDFLTAVYYIMHTETPQFILLPEIRVRWIWYMYLHTSWSFLVCTRFTVITLCKMVVLWNSSYIMANYTVGWGVWVETNKADGTELCPNRKGLVTLSLIITASEDSLVWVYVSKIHVGFCCTFPPHYLSCWMISSLTPYPLLFWNYPFPVKYKRACLSDTSCQWDCLMTGCYFIILEPNIPTVIYTLVFLHNESHDESSSSAWCQRDPFWKKKKLKWLFPLSPKDPLWIQCYRLCHIFSNEKQRHSISKHIVTWNHSPREWHHPLGPSDKFPKPMIGWVSEKLITSRCLIND